MKRAWEIYHNMECHYREEFAICLQIAWKEHKASLDRDNVVVSTEDGRRYIVNKYALLNKYIVGKEWKEAGCYVVRYKRHKMYISQRELMKYWRVAV